jgi:dihydroorotate dehydrogenase
MLRRLLDTAPRALALLPPENAHELTLKALEFGLFPRPSAPDHPSLTVGFAGMALPNPLAIAAGFDKNARVPDALIRLGCGFAEVGTVTPRAQSGNPLPRVFRLPAERAVINRLGFNNEGLAAALERLTARAKLGGVVGVNIGANKDTVDRVGDYVHGIDAFYDVASYFVINISSPNTPGLRDLQTPAALDQLLRRVMAARAANTAVGKPKRPIIVKLTCDIAEGDLPAVVEQLTTHAVDAIAISNTTLSRGGIKDSAGQEAGGLSGRPLFRRSTAMLAKVYVATGGSIPLIGIGGIDTGAAALAKIEAGATLLQLYTGLVYEGVGLIGRIKEHLVQSVRSANATALSDLVGREAETWAAMPLKA